MQGPSIYQAFAVQGCKAFAKLCQKCALQGCKAFAKLRQECALQGCKAFAKLCQECTLQVAANLYPAGPSNCRFHLTCICPAIWNARRGKTRVNAKLGPCFIFLTGAASLLYYFQDVADSSTKHPLILSRFGKLYIKMFLAVDTFLKLQFSA